MYQEYSMDNIKVEVINDNDEKVILIVHLKKMKKQ